MVDDVIVNLYHRDGGLRLNVGQGVEEMGRRFYFRLSRKRTALADVEIDQWWMHPTTVYGQRNTGAANGEAIVEYYWTSCLESGGFLADSAQDTFMLAKLLPIVRSNGGRKVFRDARPTRVRKLGADKRRIAKDLESLLLESRDQEMSKTEFQQRTAAVLGPPVYDNDVEDCYDELSGRLLETARGEFERHGTDAAVKCVSEQWQEWKQAFGRRAGHRIEKQALDMLSYECRTALHTCYSAVWWDLIPHLVHNQQMTDEAALFHRLWHLDLIDSLGNVALPNNRLFHGHVFALHPACAKFMLTATGCQLIGEYLVDPSDDGAFRRLLHGLFVAMHDYANRNDVYALLRKKEPDFVTGAALGLLESQQAERSTGRRPSGRRPSDAR